MATLFLTAIVATSSIAQCDIDQHTTYLENGLNSVLNTHLTTSLSKWMFYFIFVILGSNTFRFYWWHLSIPPTFSLCFRIAGGERMRHDTIRVRTGRLDTAHIDLSVNRIRYEPRPKDRRHAGDGPDGTRLCVLGCQKDVWRLSLHVQTA